MPEPKTTQSSEFSALKKEYRDDLEHYPKESLMRAHCLAIGCPRAPKSSTKKELARALAEAIQWSVLDSNSEYLGKLSLAERAAITDYRGAGYMRANTYLRAGTVPLQIYMGADIERMDFQLNRSDVRLAKSGKKVSVSKKIEAKLASATRTAIAKATSSALDVIKKTETMTRVVKQAPPLDREVFVWRGEKNAGQFATAETSEERFKATHGRSMRSLSVGDTFVRKDFSSFSLDVMVANGFRREQACCLFRLRLKKGERALIMSPDAGPDEMEVILPPGTSFKLVSITDVRSTLSGEEDTVIRVRNLEIV